MVKIVFGFVPGHVPGHIVNLWTKIEPWDETKTVFWGNDLMLTNWTFGLQRSDLLHTSCKKMHTGESCGIYTDKRDEHSRVTAVAVEGINWICGTIIKCLS